MGETASSAAREILRHNERIKEGNAGRHKKPLITWEVVHRAIGLEGKINVPISQAEAIKGIRSALKGGGVGFRMDSVPAHGVTVRFLIRSYWKNSRTSKFLEEMKKHAPPY